MDWRAPKPVAHSDRFAHALCVNSVFGHCLSSKQIFINYIKNWISLINLTKAPFPPSGSACFVLARHAFFKVSIDKNWDKGLETWNGTFCSTSSTVTLLCFVANTNLTQLLASGLYAAYQEGFGWLWKHKQDQVLPIYPLPNCADPYLYAWWKRGFSVKPGSLRLIEKHV